MGKEMFKPLEEEKVEKIYELLDDGESVRAIAEKLEIATGTVQKYRNEWKEEREIEGRVKENLFELEDFERELKKIPHLGKKSINFLMDVVEMDPEQIKDPAQIYKLITKEANVKGRIADTFVRGLIHRYNLGNSRSDEPPAYYPQWEGYRSPDGNGVHVPNYGSTSTDPNVPRYTENRRAPPHWGGQQTIYPPQPEPKEEKMITIEIPLRDKDGKVERDEDGEILYMRKVVPESKAGIYEEKKEEKKDSDNFIETIKVLNELGLISKKEDKNTSTSNLERRIDRLVAEIKSIRQPSPQPEPKEEKEKLTKDEVRRLMKEDRAELLRTLEDQKKDEKLSYLQNKLEEVIEQKGTHELSKLPEDVRGAKIDMETQESTAKIINEGIDNVTSKLDKAVDRFITFNKQKEETQVQLYQNTINNLMARGLSREEAIQGAKELLYGVSTPVSRQAPSPQPEVQQQKGGADDDELVEEMKRRAKQGNRR